MEQDIGKRIATLRKQNGWTQAELAAQLGVSDKAVSKWESGRGYPDIVQFPAIASLFAVSIDYLMTGAGADMPTQGELPVDAHSNKETETYQTDTKKENNMIKIRDFILQIVKECVLLLIGLGLVASALMGAFLQANGIEGYFEFIQIAFLIVGAGITVISCIRITQVVLRYRDENKQE